MSEHDGFAWIGFGARFCLSKSQKLFSDAYNYQGMFRSIVAVINRFIRSSHLINVAS